MSLYASSSVGNLKYKSSLMLTCRRLYNFMYDPLCSLSLPSRVYGRICAPYYSRLAEQYNARKR